MDARPHRAWRDLAALSFVLATTACSTADYTQAIDDFAAATGTASTALTELNAQVTQSYREVLDEAIRNREVFLRDRPGTGEEFSDCVIGSTRCRLVLIDKDDGTTVIEPYPPEPPLARMSLLMNEINSYAGNLQALLRADTAETAAAHVNAALGSVQNLATTVANLQSGADAEPADIPEFATPTGAAVNWVLGQYVETVKYKGLQRATEAAKPAIRDAAGLFQDVATFASDVPKAELKSKVDAAREAVRADPSQSNVDAYAAVAGTYDKLLISSPPDLFGKMASAHDALADSLQGDEVSLATAGARIKAFAAEAEEVVKILRDLRALTEEGQEG